MKFSRKTRHRAVADITLVPLIDLFLNILVFFLVTTTFATQSVFMVDLPEASATKPIGERELLSVAISDKGEIAFDRKAVSIEELQSRFAEVPAERRATIPVVVRADRNALHGKVVSVIDAIRGAGFQNLGIATEAPGAK